ncbi:sugar transferase [Anaerosacchariphilus polymeriproducens]|uniref:Sugar transferase n=1 Tax=Anaerosacchariphilus polymeriproducens TaxID=1812858 RepID=A0A371AR98_9FIRM|nr:sugar transferase [Anaerosacchariphilus polymeriproducens]RDU22106.1 sugar transferase [Anaerosacchariphilus polymeriproducens]
MKKQSIYQKYVKRCLDLIVALPAGILLVPVYIVLAVLVRVKLGTPVIFKQERPGYKEKLFVLYKFRTMTDQKDEHGNLLSDEERLTKFGKMLRSTSLDELPELINIIKGEMSFVGPRPLLVRYLPLYNEEQHRRHNVRPGLTGLAGVKGRNNQTWESKFKWDKKYVDHCSFILDLKIVIETFRVVFKREGIAQEGQATMEEFKGNE